MWGKFSYLWVSGFVVCPESFAYAKKKKFIWGSSVSVEVQFQIWNHLCVNCRLEMISSSVWGAEVWGAAPKLLQDCLKSLLLFTFFSVLLQ